MCHFDSTTGVAAGDLVLGLGEFGDRLPDLRLPVDTRHHNQPIPGSMTNG